LLNEKEQLRNRVPSYKNERPQEEKLPQLYSIFLACCFAIKHKQKNTFRIEGIQNEEAVLRAEASL
jgi:hypothetical protein